MDLLFSREQTSGSLRRVHFKLWGKIELDEAEQALIDRYSFDSAVLISVAEPDLLRRSAIIGVIVMALLAVLLVPTLGFQGMILAPLLGLGAGYGWYNEQRETIYVRDLLHGRHFKCDSVVALAKKEAWLTDMVSFLRQVMESAKHWDGTESFRIEALPRDEARQVILRA